MMMTMMRLLILAYSDGGAGWWELSADRTQLTLVQPRSCVVSCNVSSLHGSLLSTARLAILPPGQTRSSSLTYLLTYVIVCVRAVATDCIVFV